MSHPVSSLPQSRTSLSFSHSLRWVWRQHFIGSLAIVLFTTTVIAVQVSNRTDFASTQLAQDVESRWGAPVEQAAPSVRSVQSGTVFTELSPPALSVQHVNVNATERVSTRVGLWVATQVVPTVAVLLPGYTGLITLELLVLLLGSMTLLTSPAVRAFLSDDPAGESVIAGGAS